MLAFPLGGALFGAFALIWLLLLGSYLLALAAIISVATTPAEAFGPWWDNTRQTWLIGIVVSFLIPFGHIITAIMWFTTGRRPLHYGQYVGRPFWAGPPRPEPPRYPPYPPTPPPPR
jgi:hypothetical protein